MKCARIVATIGAFCLAVVVLSPSAAHAASTGGINGTISGPGGSALASDSNLWVVIYNAAGHDVNETSVASDGTYEVSGLVAGQYRVGISDSAEIYGNEFFADQSTLAAATPVAVAGGATTRNVDMELNNGGQITGNVVSAAGGDLDLEASVGVLVYDASGRAIRSTTVLPDGTYSVGGLAEGEYRLKFTDSTESPVYAAQFYSGKRTLAGATPLQVDAGATASAATVHLDSAHTISGYVTGDGGVPLDPEALVFADLWTADEQGVPDVVASAQVAEDGAYFFPAIAVGEYRVSYRDDADIYGSTFYGGANALAGAAVVEVADGIVSPSVDVNLVRGGTVTGIVTGPAGVPLVQPSEVYVTAYNSLGSAVATATVSEAGAYSLAGLPTGLYRLEFRDSFSTYVSEFYSGKSTLDEATPISVTTGQTTTAVDESLAAMGAIVGSVTATGGSTLDANGMISVRAYNSVATVVAEVEVQPNGGFYLADLPVDEYRLQFVDASDTYLTEFYANKQTLATATPVNVTAGEILTGVAVELDRPVTPAPPNPAPPNSAPPNPVPPAPVNPGPAPTPAPARNQSILKAPTSLKRKKSKTLARTTGGGLAANWSSATPKVCKVKAGKVVAGKKKGTCRLNVAAFGDARWLPLRQSFIVKIK